MTRKIVLYSGGLDSYIGLWLLRRQDPSWTPVYFHLTTQYGLKEWLHIPKPDGLDDVVAMLDLSRLERDDAFVPQRNVMLCAAAQAVYDADQIALCSVADDIYADNKQAFHDDMSKLLTTTARHQVRVFSPLLEPTPLTKAQAVRLYLRHGVAYYMRRTEDEDALRQTVSCYDPVEVSCGRCKACVRRKEALEANGIML